MIIKQNETVSCVYPEVSKRDKIVINKAIAMFKHLLPDGEFSFSTFAKIIRFHYLNQGAVSLANYLEKLN